MRNFACLLALFVASNLLAAEPVQIVVDGPLELPAQRALAELERAFKAHDLEVTRLDNFPENRTASIVVGTIGASKIIAKLKADGQLPLAKEVESLCIKRVHLTQVIAGSDTRGLVYALLEAARGVALAPDAKAAKDAILEATESPFLRTRTMSMHLFNHDLEQAFYFDETFWVGYFTMLARERYNNFNLTFSDQTNYLTPMYAYLVDVPGHAKVRVKGLSDEDRGRNLAMLKRIAELARERGLDFTLGIWAQAPVAAYPGEIRVQNLPEGMELADYCAKGLKAILQACPAINGIQFRMNTEAGVSEKMQAAFFTALFKAIQECGRPITLDLRFKGLLAETIDAAVAAGFDLIVSFKFWCEHFGLPYHPTVAERRYRESRYSYGSALAKPRKYRVVYQLWTMGCQRLLLWGDPDYAARFAQNCKLGDGEGFEVYAPLTNKGYGTEPGAWRIFADRRFEVGTWEYERYWFFYLSFGRLGYNPQANPEIWKRELRARFGAAADDVGEAYRQASQVIPFVTATHLPSASEWWWWPEMDTGGRLAEYQRVQPSDTAKFYAIRSWKRTPNWVWEEWDATIPGYVEDAVAGKLQGKMTPWDAARHLQRLSEQTSSAVARARKKIGASPSAEFRGTDLDMTILAELARYHAAKMRSATHLALFEMTGAAGRLPEASKQMQLAADAWNAIVQKTDRVYYHNLSFGIPKGNPRSRGGQHHSGHWKDRLPEIQGDLDYLAALQKKHDGAGKTFRLYPGESVTAHEVAMQYVPPAKIDPGMDLPIDVHVASKSPLKNVLVHFRPLDQTAEWKSLALKRDGDRWHATISSKDILGRWDFMLYFEVQLDDGTATLWPAWHEKTPYYVLSVQKTAK